MILKWFKTRRAKKNLENALRLLWESSESVKVSRSISAERITSARCQSEFSLQQLSNNVDHREDFYQLYLHKQYMAFLIENVRQRQRELRRIEGKTDPLEWRHGEAFLNSTARLFNQQLYQDFIEEIVPWLDQEGRRD